MSEQIIVIGGGLAGLSAAHTVLEHGGRVLLLDKCPFLGGNSTKATSGINGALTRTQAAKGIQDSADKFEADIIRGAAGVGHTTPPEHTVPLAKVRPPSPRPRTVAATIFFLLASEIPTRFRPLTPERPPRPRPSPSRVPGSRPGKRQLRRLALREVRPRPLPRLPARCAPPRPPSPFRDFDLEVNIPPRRRVRSEFRQPSRFLFFSLCLVSSQPPPRTSPPNFPHPQAVTRTLARTAARSASPDSRSRTR